MKKILIVEDDPIVANLYRQKLSLEGYQVEVALDGEQGLATTQRFRPDALLMDLVLPKLSGVELLRQIRALPGFQQTPVIVFSNAFLSNLVQEAWEAGATKCLSKASCSPKQLLEVLRSTLSPNGSSGATAALHTPASPAAPPAPGHPQAPTAGAEAGADLQFQEELHQSLVAGFPALLSGLRTELQGLVKSDNQAARGQRLQELYRRVHCLTGNAGMAGLRPLAQLSAAFEALLQELHDKPNQLTASTLRTLATTVDCFGLLFERGLAPAPQQLPPPHILVVDDEALSRRALTCALERAQLKCAAVADPRLAYQMLSEQQFDLVFLDVDMPEMNGFELCTRLRSLPAYQKTPVVFVTNLNDFESRANSTMSGGNDFIAKPFLFLELAVKALVYLLRAPLDAAPARGA